MNKKLLTNHELYIIIKQTNSRFVLYTKKEQNNMKQEEKSIIQRIAEQRNNLFLSSMIARKVIKLSQKVIPGTTKSPLSEKYWRNIITQANEVYPSLEKKFSEFNMTLADLRYCYLVLFHLDTISEAILLNIQPDSVNKRRQRVRQKLGIIGEELDLYTYIINMM